MGMTADIELETRSTIDAIAAEVGPTLRVTEDAVHACDPARPDLGEEYIYGVLVETTPGARERLLGDFATAMRAEGWEVYPRGDDEVAFRRGNATLGATIDSKPEAYVSGSSGCH